MTLAHVTQEKNTNTAMASDERITRKIYLDSIIPLIADMVI